MEMGDQSCFDVQVHTHAYLGFLQKESTLIFAKQVSVPLMALTFCNVKPYVVATRGLRGRRLHDCAAQAMHYVVGPKSSGLFRATDLEPIQDLLVPLQACAPILCHARPSHIAECRSDELQFQCFSQLLLQAHVAS